jgi:protein-disulfide isomerase
MLVRPFWIATGAAIVLAVLAPCAAGQAPADPPASIATAGQPVMRDIAMGMADAPVAIVEYASVTCAACQHFQTDILPRLKARYILSGQAKFILHDHPTPPAPISFAAFALARCAGESEFYAVIGDLFARQTELLSAARAGDAKRYLVQIGAAHGLSQPQVDACLNDQALQAFIQRQLDDSPEMAAAPAVYVNGKRVPGVTYDAIAQAVDDAIAATAPVETPPAPTISPPASHP